MVDFVAILTVVTVFLVFGLLSRRPQGTVITGPMIFTLAGLIAGPAGAEKMREGLVNSALATDTNEVKLAVLQVEAVETIQGRKRDESYVKGLRVHKPTCSTIMRATIRHELQVPGIDILFALNK